MSAVMCTYVVITVSQKSINYVRVLQSAEYRLSETCVTGVSRLRQTYRKSTLVQTEQPNRPVSARSNVIYPQGKHLETYFHDRVHKYFTISVHSTRQCKHSLNREFTRINALSLSCLVVLMRKHPAKQSN